MCIGSSPKIPPPPPPPPPLPEKTALSVGPPALTQIAENLKKKVGTSQLVVPFDTLNVPK